MAAALTLPRLLFRTSPRALVLATLCSFLSGGVSIALLASVRAALAARDAVDISRFGGLCLVLLVLQLGSRMIVVRLGQRALYDLRVHFAKRVLASPLRDLERIGSSKIFATIAGNATDIVIAIINTPGMLADTIVVLGCLAYCTWLWPIGGLVMAVLLVSMVALSRAIQMRGRKKLFALFDKESKLFGHIRALVDGAKELKINRDRREAFEQLFAESAGELRDGNIRAMSLLQLAIGWGATLGYVLLAMILFALPRVFGAPPPDVLVGFVLAFLVLTPALGFVLTIWNTLVQANVTIEKVDALGLSLIEERGAAHVEPRRDWHPIELAGVTYRYHREGDDTAFALGPLDLALAPGEIVFVVGGNGSGKSTLAKILTGLYAPDAGAIRCAGEPVTDTNRDAYRALFSAVFSDFYLFEQLLGVIAPDRDAQARGYLHKLALSRKVAVQDGKLNTIDLSQGQRKRLALLTAYLEDRPIYVFDEWAADQDPEFRALFYTQLLPELKERGKAVVAITHDDRYFHCADRIIKLDEGRIVALPASAPASDSSSAASP